MDVLPQLLASAVSAIESHGPNITIFDIGCNKGYASMDYLDALTPWTKLNPMSLYVAMEATMKEEGFIVDKHCGVCNDCRKPLAGATRVTEAARWTAGVKAVNVYCYEPAPSTFKMLQQVGAVSSVLPSAHSSCLWDQKCMRRNLLSVFGVGSDRIQAHRSCSGLGEYGRPLRESYRDVDLEESRVHQYKRDTLLAPQLRNRHRVRAVLDRVA
jgi:hypothetical protein